MADAPLPAQRLAFARALLRWFDAHQRDLPWRHNRDPYRIWVSEVMLQQTQVATVIPFFERFLQRFPDVASLAAADEQEVLRHWEGLGYYRRARHLHQAAQRLMQDHGGTLPDDPEVWADLPGIGPYMLGAVLSQAFDRSLPIVEANTQRVLARLFAEMGDIKSGPVKKRLWQLAESLLPNERIGDFNQAMMELGSLVCTPTAPRCDECPVRRWCSAQAQGIAEQLPSKSGGPAITAVREIALVIRSDANVLLVQRPDGVRWAGMWEFPALACEPPANDHSTIARILAEQIGLQAELVGEVATIGYGVTRYRVTLVGYLARYRSGTFASSFYSRGEWVTPTQLTDFPVSVAHRKLAQHVAAGSTQPHLFD